ncbi:hypothetical protein [Marinobacterium sedimentorum]|uniref:hypothetical protein n=1 Tax=Marinobacterium sedimentorum TaxID=2927804 RepID=UPI0020C70C72|nr:hypothetical protein [Marinobacterium sedimentorum]MCP8687048.1 hypothetical protein [Marinobacterium sedimentorum]
MKALLYTLTLLLFSLGVSASEQASDEALPASHADFSTVSAVIDPVPCGGADRVFAVVVLTCLFDLPQNQPGLQYQAAYGTSISGLQSIRAPPVALASLSSV